MCTSLSQYCHYHCCHNAVLTFTVTMLCTSVSNLCDIPPVYSHVSATGFHCTWPPTCTCIRTYLLLAECEVRTASYGPSYLLPFMAQARSAQAMKTRKEKRGSITCQTDWANEANKMFIIWLWWLFRFWKGDRELEVRTATYGPGIDQSQHAKSFSHIIITFIANSPL